MHGMCVVLKVQGMEEEGSDQGTGESKVSSNISGPKNRSSSEFERNEHE